VFRKTYTFDRLLSYKQTLSIDVMRCAGGGREQGRRFNTAGALAESLRGHVR